MNPSACKLPSSLRRSRQRGAALLKSLGAVLALAAVAGGGWYGWSRYQGTQGPAAGASAPQAGTPAAAASGAAAGAAGGAGGNRRFAGNRVQPVSVATVRSQDLRVMVSAIGNLVALNTAVVRTKVDGELRAIRFREGEQVRAGQVLAEIDPRSYEIAVAQAQGQLARDQAQLRNAQIDLERYKELLAKDSIARQQVDTQDALVRQLAGTVQTDQAALDNARLLLSYTKVTAPISGRLGLKQTDLGNMVRASDAAGLVSITQTQPIAIVFAVPEAYLPQITRKLKSREPLVVQAWDREQKVRLATGKVSTTDNAIDASTGTIKLKAEFPNADGQLFPNQFANIRLQLDTQSDALVVPAAAVQRGAIGTFVYVVKEDSTVTVRRIRMGASEGELISVQGELAAGDKVVTDGADRLREGAKVEVIVPPVRPGAGGARPRGDAPGAAAGAPAGSAAPGGTPGPSTGSAGPGPSTGSAAPGARGGAAKGDAAAAGAPAGRAAAGAAGSAPGAADAGGRPPWLDRLPPEMQERVLKMNPEERRAFIEQLRERRRQREQGGGD